LKNADGGERIKEVNARRFHASSCDEEGQRLNEGRGEGIAGSGGEKAIVSWKNGRSGACRGLIKRGG